MNYAYQSYLAHFGIKGQKWGERRFQNEDGTLTPAGRERYSKDLDKNIRKNWVKAYNEASDNFNKDLHAINNKYRSTDMDLNKSEWNDNDRKYVQEVNSAWKKRYSEAAQRRFGDNPLYAEMNLNVLPMYSMYDQFYDEHVRK